MTGQIADKMTVGCGNSRNSERKNKDVNGFHGHKEPGV